MAQSKLLIVVCTPLGLYAEYPVRKSLRALEKDHRVETKVFAENTRGLSTVYNEVLYDPENKNTTVLFVHDDVEIHDLFLVDKLLTSPYSITGVAGTKSHDKRSKNRAWHIASKREDYVGEAGHFHPSKGYWTTVFGPTNSRALVVDGLFIACKVNDVVNANLKFDETFQFHFYDIAFCLRANKQKVTCGVLPVCLYHHGLGDSMNTEEWRKSNELFLLQYA